MFILNSLYFPVFLIVSALLYYVVPSRYQNLLLLIVSFGFYFTFSVSAGLWLLASVAVLYLLSYLQREGKASRIVFVLAAFITMGSLVGVKYLDFLLAPFGVRPMSGITAPVGISFFAFQAFSYFIDLKRGKIRAETNPVNFALYLTFFPCILSGPICRADQMLPQYATHRRFSWEDISTGSALYITGLFKKAVVADAIGSFVDGVFRDFGMYSGITLFAALAGFALQLYFDFSGYSEMAMGAAKALGINVPVNFATPYFSQSYREFWSRWHISLTRWFTDYLYIPLGGNRKGKVRKYLNILIVFAVSGLWHGAGLTYLCWGLMQGIFRCADDLLLGNKKLHSEFLPVRILKSVIVFLCWSSTMVFFRAPNMSDALQYIGDCFRGGGPAALWNEAYAIIGGALGGGDAYIRLTMAAMALCLVFAFFLGMQTYRNNSRIPEDSLGNRKAARYLGILFMVVMILCFGNFGQSTFIYFNF